VSGQALEWPGCVRAASEAASECGSVCARPNGCSSDGGGRVWWRERGVVGAPKGRSEWPGERQRALAGEALVLGFCAWSGAVCGLPCCE